MNLEASNLRLDSWKEIAGYLKRDIRTVQLWEKKEGLPVHRHAHAARASVYAYSAELDAWQITRKPQLDAEPQIPSAPAVDRGNETPQNETPQAVRSRLPVYIYTAAALLTLTIVLVVGLRWQRTHRQAYKLEPSTMLAVLPFEDLSATSNDDHWSEGLTDDVITVFGRSGQLQVISRTSISRFKDKQEPLPQIARTLHANLVLEGTIVRSGQRVRITAQLIDAANDRHLWAGSYERNFSDVLSLQDEVAGNIFSDVMQKLTGGAPNLNATTKPVDPDARLAYLMGRFFWNKRNEPGLQQAIRYFDDAIAKDPNYAPAYSGLADCYNLLSVWGSIPSQEAFPKAKAAALKALQLDPGSAEAYTSLAFETYRYDWDFSDAERDFRKAIQLNPNYATAHQWYGEFLVDMTRFEEAIAEHQKAVQLDPLSTIVGSDYAMAYIYARRYSEGVRELERVLTMDPGFVPAHQYLAAAYQWSGQTAKAEEERETYARLSGDTGPLESWRISETWSSGKKKEAQERLEALLKRTADGRFSYVHMAQVYLSVGDKEKAFECLDKAYEKRSWWLVVVLVERGFDPVRKDTRFLNLVHRVGLPTT